MTQEELKSVLESELKAFKENLSEYASKEDIQNKLSEFETKLNDLNMADELKELKSAVETQGMAINKISVNVDHKPKTLKDQLTEKLEALKNLSVGASRDTVTIKTDVTRASVTNHTLSMRLSDVGQLATQANRIAPLFAQGTVSAGMGGVVRYVDQSSVTNAAAAVSEAGVKPESAIAWQEYTMALQKVAHNIPVTMESLQDIGWMESEINNNLLKYLDIKVDNYLWSGTGSSPQINGIYTQADTYTASAEGQTDANIFDLIRRVSTNIKKGTMYSPNYAIMNADDIDKMILKKDGNNNYVRPDFAILSNGMLRVGNITIIESNSVTANTMLVGDFSFATLYRMGGVTLNVGWIDKQFVENMVTVQAEQRLGLLVRNAHTDAFNKVASISAALTTLAS